MIAFLVATPYQLLASMQIRTHIYKNESADIYLLTFNTHMENYAQALKNSKLYQDVYVTYAPYDRIGAKATHFQRMKEFVFPASDVAAILKKKKYDILFSTRIGLGNPYFYHFLKQNNANMRFMYYDEGMGDYSGPLYRRGGKLDTLRELLGYEDPTKNKTEMEWLYRPDLQMIRPYCKVCQIPSISAEDTATRLFVNEKQLPPMDVIYLDNFWAKEGIYLDFSRFDAIAKKVGLDDLLWVKLHPTQKYPNIQCPRERIFPDDGVPWELQYMRQNVSHAILVSISSTATISPKMLYDAEPTVVMLYKLFDVVNKSGNSREEEFFRAVQASYSSNRFFIPETWEEAECVFAQLTREVHENQEFGK